MRTFCPSLGLAVCSWAAVVAQNPIAWVASGPDGLFGPAGNMPWGLSFPVSATAGVDSEVYYTRSDVEVWEMRTIVPRLARMGTAPGPVTALCVTDDTVWFATDQGRIGSFARGVPLQAATMLIDLPSVGITGQPRRLASDGRELYVFTQTVSGQTANLFGLDTANGGLPVRAVATIPYLASDRVDAAGNLWVFVSPPALARLDPWTGVSSAPSLTVPVGNQHCSVDPWGQKAVAAMTITYQPPLPPYSNTFYAEGDIGTASWRSNWPIYGGRVGYVVASVEAPYTIYGRGCRHGQQREARLAFGGMPEQGGAIALRMRQGEPNAGVLFWLGMSRTHWAPLGALPADLGALGAPGCRILASAEVVLFAVTDAAGATGVTLPIPVDPALAGLRLHAQAACATAANRLGWATSDGIHIRIR